MDSVVACADGVVVSISTSHDGDLGSITSHGLTAWMVYIYIYIYIIM